MEEIKTLKDVISRQPAVINKHYMNTDYNMLPEINVIKKAFSKLCAKDAATLLDDLKLMYHDMTTINNSRITDEIKAIAKVIFEKCPKCNVIPIAVESESGSHMDRTVDMESLLEACESINRISVNTAAPYFDDDMTKRAYDEMLNAYRTLVESLGFAEVQEELDDYCEYYHMNVYVINKEDYAIDYLSDINH